MRDLLAKLHDSELVIEPAWLLHSFHLFLQQCCKIKQCMTGAFSILSVHCGQDCLQQARASGKPPGPDFRIAPRRAEELRKILPFELIGTFAGPIEALSGLVRNNQPAPYSHGEKTQIALKMTLFGLSGACWASPSLFRGMAAVLSESVLDQHCPNDHFGQHDLIPNWIFAFARPKWTKMVHFGLKRSRTILVHLGPPTVLWPFLIVEPPCRYLRFMFPTALATLNAWYNLGLPCKSGGEP